MRVVLASASPRRAEYLKMLGIDPIVIPSDVAENGIEGDCRDVAVKLATQKMQDSHKKILSTGIEADLIIAADTIVSVDGRSFGKPTDQVDAAAMLRQLSGRIHEVVTGVAVMRLNDGAIRSEVECTTVTLSTLSEEAISAYISTEEPMDKAGAYGIQGKGGLFVDSIDGCFYNVAGIPLALLRRMLEDLGFSLWKVW